MRAICIALLLAAGGLPAHAACPPGERFAGILVEPRGQEVAVGRAGRTVRLVAGSERLCTGDLIVAGPAAVTFRLKVVRQVDVTVPAGKERAVPTALELFGDLLRSWVPFLAQEETEGVRAVTLGGEREFEFGVAGLMSGAAVVTPRGGPIYVPVRSDYAVDAVLMDPRGRASKPRGAPSGASLVGFDPVDAEGTWRIRLRRPDGALEGRFQVARPPKGSGDLGDPASFEAMAQFACRDVARNGLESLRGLNPADRDRLAKLLAYWSDPDAESFCAAAR